MKMKLSTAEPSMFQTTFREAEKQTRAFEVGKRVRIFNSENALVDVCAIDRAERYLRAPNSQLLRTHGGKIIGIKLLSFGDDRNHSVEHHGSSLTTTQRVRNDQGTIIAPDFAVAHKGITEA